MQAAEPEAWSCGGLAGARIRAIDWSATSLGPRSQWPQPLKTTVDLMLCSRVPMLLLWGQEGTLLYNDAYDTLVGGTGALGHRYNDLPFAAQLLDQASFQQILAAGVAVSCERVVLLQRGGVATKVWLNIAASPVPDAECRPVGVLVILTEQLQAEAGLRQSESHFRAIAELVPDLLWRTGPCGDVEWYNQRWIDYTGLSLARSLSVGFFDVVHPDDRPRFRDALQAALWSGTPLRHEQRLRAADGCYRWFLVRLNPVPDQHGFTSHWFGAATDIHDQRTALAALQANEALLRAGIAVANLALAEVDYTTGTIWLSAEAALLYGLGDHAQTVSRRRLHATFHPDERDRLFALIEQALRHEREGMFVCEHRVCWPDGQVHWLNVHKQVFFEHNSGVSRPTHAILVARDITARRQALDQIRASEEKFRLFVEHSPAATAMLDCEMRYLAASRRWLQIFKLPSDIIGLRHYDLFPDLPDRWKVIHRRCLKGAVERAEEDCFERADGSVIWLTWEIRPWFDSTGAIGGIVVFSEDITARKRVEQALRDSEQHLRSVFEGIDEGFFIIDLICDATDQVWDYRFLQANSAFERLTGLMNVAGRTARELIPQLNPFWLAIYGQVLRTGKAMRFERQADFMPHWFDVHVMRIGDATSRRLAVVFNDITARKHAEAERERLYSQEQTARLQAEEASRIKDEFLATISHELRTPLTAFLGYAELLLRRTHDQAYVERMAEKLVRSAKIQAQLVEDLLDVSRILNGKLRLETHPVNLASVISAAIDTVRPAATAKQILVRVALDLRAAAIVGDANRMQQVVWNLLSNATKFTPAGGEIVVQLARDGQYARLTVSDTGQGISAEFLPFVFDRFRQADSSTQRQHGGLGLGLSIVRHVVELHGGTVQAFSDGIGRGACFEVLLPLSNEAAALHAAGPTDTNTAERGCPPALWGLRVLVVDDQPDILELLQEILIPCGTVVRACASAREALDLLQDWRPEVLVSDIAMPSEDGYWLIRQLRALPPEQGGATPAIALTAYARVEDRLQTLAAGYQLYLPKPVDQAELRDLVASLTQASAAE